MIKLKEILMTLGNRLVQEHGYDPGEYSDKPKNTLPIQDFIIWLNGCEEAWGVLAELGVEWPVMVGYKPHLRQRLITLAEEHAKVASECEKYGNTTGTMQMRAISNLLYTLGQAHNRCDTLMPMKDRHKPSDDFKQTFSDTMIIEHNHGSLVIVNALERIALDQDEDKSVVPGHPVYVQESASGYLRVTCNATINGSDDCHRFASLWRELKRFGVDKLTREPFVKVADLGDTR